MSIISASDPGDPQTIIGVSENPAVIWKSVVNFTFTQ